jgi:putative ABC transport system permease protein
MSGPDLGAGLRLAARRLTRSPGFSLVVLAITALAVAALLTLGTAAMTLLWRPLPYVHGERLVQVQGFASQMQASIGFAPGLLEPLAAMPGVEAIGVYDYAPPLYDAQGHAFENIRVQPGLAELLGARPQLGRLIQAEDGDDVVVLSDAAWRGRFGADPGVVGRRIDFDGQRLGVVGVLAPDFHFPDRSTAIWRALRLTPDQRSGTEAFNFGAVQVLARLAPDVSPASLEAALQAGPGQRPELEPMRQFLGLRLTATSLRRAWDAGRSTQLGLLAAAAGAVMLLLLANLGSLWLARCLQRARELAVRSALGASARRMATELVLEVALLASGAVMLGLLAVPPGLAMLESLAVLDPNAAHAPVLDAATVAAAVLLALLLIGLLSLAPIWVARRARAEGLLAQGMRGLGAGRSAGTLRRALVALQVALAVSLLCGAGLLTRSLVELVRQDVGFDPDGVSLVMLEARGGAPVPGDEGRAALATLRAAFAGIPGISDASFANAPPFSYSESISSLLVEGAGEAEVSARNLDVDAHYLGALGMPILRGRGFVAEDATEAEPGILVDERFVALYLDQREPLGVRVRVGGGPGSTPAWSRIVGVVPQVRHMQLAERGEQATFYRLDETPALSRGRAILVVRSELPGVELARIAREHAAAVGLRATDVASLDRRMRDSLGHRLSLMGLVGGFALFGVLLAGVGLFALVAFSVQRRLAEFGLRLALGARPSDLRRLALREGLLVALPGLLVGTLGAIAVGRLLASQLYRVTAADPVTLGGVVLLALGLVLVACLGPARRAARLDPLSTLRHD